MVESSGKKFFSLTFVRKSSANSKKTNIKDIFKKYNNFTNACVMLYDDDMDTYENIAGVSYEDFIDKVSN